MNKIAKRLVAGASAAALLVSAVGVDRLADLFMKTSYADAGDDRGKYAQSTGFNNLEQDTTTDNAAYNTGYGLHTNKTARVAEGTDDGRTFDVDLESWYVGENPVDVATILDASGSMAWTVDTLEPLVINYSCFDDYEKANGVKIEKLADLQEIQEEHNGYLPQDIVDCILNPTNTDNSKLSYAGYKYYVYEERSSVSEFVPLGYWDGGKPSGALKPIGYYPFNGTLENKAPDGTAATVIKRVSSGSTFDTTPLEDVPVELQFKNSGLSLSEVDKKGNVIIDLSNQLDTTQDIEIDFDLRFDNIVGNMVPQSPILYLGDGTTSNYFALVRGRSNTSTGASTSLSILGKGISSTTVANKQITNYTKWYSCKLSISSDGDNLTVVFTMDGGTPVTVNNIGAKLGDKLILTLGGNEILPHGNLDTNDDGIDDIDPTNLQGNYIRNLEISGTKSASGAFNAKFSLKDKDGLTDSEGNEITAQYCNQSTGDTFDLSPAVTSPVEYIGNALNLTQTAKKDSAVKLDAKPVDSTYTIMFKVKSSRKLENKSGADDRDRGPQSAENLFYIGSNDTSNDYYHIGIPDNSDPKHLHFYEYNSKSNEDKKISDGDRLPANNGVFGDTNSKYVAYVIDGTNINSYFDIAGSIKKGSDTLTNELDTSDINVILAGLTDTYSNNFEISIDDLYIFDEALNEEQVKLVAENAGKTEFAILPSALTDGCKGYHATTSDGKEIAQISESLAQNPNDGEREGWYYVNSHSKWEDISGCLAGGKQYLGIRNDDYLGKVPTKPSQVGGKDADGSNAGDPIENPDYDISADKLSHATVPSVWEAAYKGELDSSTVYDQKQVENFINLYNSLKAGDSEKEFTPSENERSIQFYVDSQGYLRCFYCTGDQSWKKSDGTWKYSPRTFCSLVYVKEPYTETKSTDGDGNTVVTREGNPTKYEELNYALNQFYQNLAKYSDLSNSAIVRFSTHNLIQGNSEKEVENNAEAHLKMLIMKDWTNWSDKYIESGKELQYDKYLQDLLIPTADETSTNTENSSTRPDIKEYPYVMTGGTYTWTGLKAFYDNMVNTDELSSGDTVYNIANDARDKYLIIFTDGRDNLIGEDSTKYVNEFTSSTDKNGKVTVKTYGNFSPEDHNVTKDEDLAEAWAEKLKDEGYTIFCVMMATGSISPTTNATEYEKAYNFLKKLAGDKENKRDVEDCISVVGVDNTLEEAFADILKQIQLPRNDYTVQDYIDPRFDLVDKNEGLLKLGANGVITKADGTEIKKVGNIIDALDTNPDMTAEECKELGLAYTPIDSYMVNRKPQSGTKDGYDTGDDVGTGYIYYDDEKDMYYLRWTDQIIPMENEAFNTEAPDNKKLDVWSATIRLKAKDDFIGGNNILTNGNEAGENLVYSDATIENMDKGENYKLYGFVDDDRVDGKVPYRKKLEALSGTDRKINAVDADGVSQAVYGDGIDIPSSGFPRTTVNVRLLPLNANNLSDVIYMGEVVSPTMMLADLENGYMTGSYYLQYLERYAYRVYGDSAGDTPLIELLNQWLKINDETVAEKTFTIPYMYLPDPEYDKDNNLVKDSKGKVVIENSTGWDSEDRETLEFADLNLRDVTGFITYTWKRSDGQDELQQQMDSDPSKYDITKDYVVKNTKQIKYNLQLTFTPLKEDKLPTEFKLGENFIDTDKFFNIRDDEFYDVDVTGWRADFTRADYLQAMIQETRTYEPHVMYDGTAGNEKWKLIEEADKITALSQYTDDPQTEEVSGGKVTDSCVYDWTPGYKPAEGKVQLEGNKSGDESSLKNINDYYTTTPNNVNLLGADGKAITDGNGAIEADKDPVSLAANTTYTKDVVNAALALELFIDGKYLQGTGQIIKEGTTYTFDAVRYYNDPIDPLPYDEDPIGADTGVGGKKYKLTFEVTDIPADVKENEISKVWAKLTQVQVETGTGTYQNIDATASTVTPTYIGYEKPDALPIGTYEIKTEPDTDETKLNSLKNEQFKIGTEGSNDVNFKYLKIDNDPRSYTYDRFPTTVSGVSASAATSTGDGEYLIWNDSTDNSTKNIAESNREKKADNTYTLTFNFGTVDTESSKGVKGESTKDHLAEVDESGKYSNEYTKDRLGIIMLSADNNSLAITKEITNYKTSADLNQDWTFTVTIKTDDADWISEHETNKTIKYDLYTRTTSEGDWVLTSENKNKVAEFVQTPEGTTYKLTVVIKLKHNQKALLKDLPDGDWQVTEVEQSGVLYTPHNNANGLDEDEWHYQRSEKTNVNTLTPISQVDFENEFPYELPSAGGSGTLRFVLFGTLLTAVGAMLFAVLYFDRRKKARK